MLDGWWTSSRQADHFALVCWDGCGCGSWKSDTWTEYFLVSSSTCCCTGEGTHRRDPSHHPSHHNMYNNRNAPSSPHVSASRSTPPPTTVTPPCPPQPALPTQSDSQHHHPFQDNGRVVSKLFFLSSIFCSIHPYSTAALESGDGGNLGRAGGGPP
jgi:hypothetical protein